MLENIAHTFIKELKKVKPEIKCIKPFRYRIYYNGHYRTETFHEHLDNLHEDFRIELLNLPAKLQSKENRHVHLDYINNELYYTKDKLENYLAGNIYSKFPHAKNINIDIPFTNISHRNYKDKIIYESKKLSYMVHQQIKQLQITINTIQEFAKNDNLELLKTNGFELKERVKSNMNNAELSLYFKLVYQVVAKDGKFNKKDLARILSNSFSTKEKEYPSENKIYNSFTNYHPQTIEKVKSLFIELLNNINYQ